MEFFYAMHFMKNDFVMKNGSHNWGKKKAPKKFNVFNS